jgi:hypothetical protein
MKIAALINAHKADNLLIDTLDSVINWVTRDTMVVFDGAFRDQRPRDFFVPIVEGFEHNFRWGPYRNVMLGLKSCSEAHNDADWYLYCEPDVLFASDKFKLELQVAEQDNVWCLGFDHRNTKCEIPLLEKIFGEKLGPTQYLIGCCVFYKGSYIRRLRDIGFFDKFLMLTNEFKRGFFPNCMEQDIIDISEHMYPTIAKHWGGGVRGLTTWNEMFQSWTAGKIRDYRVRWRPEIQYGEGHVGISIFHPIKNASSPIRQFYRMERMKLRKLCR